jgi:hypothetical protein
VSQLKRHVQAVLDLADTLADDHPGTTVPFYEELKMEFQQRFERSLKELPPCRHSLYESGFCLGCGKGTSCCF